MSARRNLLFALVTALGCGHSDALGGGGSTSSDGAGDLTSLSQAHKPEGPPTWWSETSAE
jgi:hypothetical protein